MQTAKLCTAATVLLSLTVSNNWTWELGQGPSSIKANAKDLICQWPKKKTKANNDHKMMMSMMNKIVGQENSHSY